MIDSGSRRSAGGIVAAVGERRRLMLNEIPARRAVVGQDARMVIKIVAVAIGVDIEGQVEAAVRVGTGRGARRAAKQLVVDELQAR